MKTAKLCLGIISIILSMMTNLYSCTLSISEMANEMGTHIGALGMVSSFFFLCAGIVGIAARSSKGGAVATTLLYVIAMLISGVGSFQADILFFFAIMFLCFAIVFFISIFTQKYSKPLQKV